MSIAKSLLAIALTLGASTCLRAQSALDQDLQALDNLRRGRETDLEAVDRLGTTLLKQYEQPAQQAQVYYQLAHVHAQSGLKAPKQIVEYATVALESKLLSPEQRGTLYSYLSSAHEVDSTVKDFAARRRLAVAPLLKGMAELQRFGLPEIAPELPAIRARRGEFDDSPEARREQEAQIQARRDAQRIVALVQRRDVLASQVKWLYAREPLADDELTALAEKVVGKVPAAQLAASAKAERERVEQARQARQKKMKASP